MTKWNLFLSHLFFCRLALYLRILFQTQYTIFSLVRDHWWYFDIWSFLTYDWVTDWGTRMLNIYIIIVSKFHFIWRYEWLGLPWSICFFVEYFAGNKVECLLEHSVCPCKWNMAEVWCCCCRYHEYLLVVIFFAEARGTALDCFNGDCLNGGHGSGHVVSWLLLVCLWLCSGRSRGYRIGRCGHRGCIGHRLSWISTLWTEVELVLVYWEQWAFAIFFKSCDLAGRFIFWMDLTSLSYTSEVCWSGVNSGSKKCCGNRSKPPTCGRLLWLERRHCNFSNDWGLGCSTMRWCIVPSKTLFCLGLCTSLPSYQVGPLCIHSNHTCCCAVGGRLIWMGRYVKFEGD